MTMSAIDTEPFPRGVLIAVGILLTGVILVAGTARWMKLRAPHPASVAFQIAPASTIDLAFSDGADGSVSVRESGSGRLLKVLAPGTNGFVRGVLRGLAQNRLRRGIGAGPPFRLSQFQDGNLSLLDTATGRVIDLQSFGVDNRAAFVQFLPAPGAQVSGARS
jgi:putative photosynthetic complex assembly protein